MLPCLRLPMRLQVGRLSVAGSLGPAQTSPPYQTIKVTQECLLLDSTGSRSQPGTHARALKPKLTLITQAAVILVFFIAYYVH